MNGMEIMTIGKQVGECIEAIEDRIAKMQQEIEIIRGAVVNISKRVTGSVVRDLGEKAPAGDGAIAAPSMNERTGVAGARQKLLVTLTGLEANERISKGLHRDMVMVVQKMSEWDCAIFNDLVRALSVKP